VQRVVVAALRDVAAEDQPGGARLRGLPGLIEQPSPTKTGNSARLADLATASIARGGPKYAWCANGAPDCFSGWES
jgi:hypothetical protein